MSNNLKYAIISINDRAKDNTDNTKKILSNYEKLNIRCVNGHIEPINDIMLELSIHKNNWQWVSPKNGEIGLWLTNILLYKKMIEEDIDMCLLIEDDCILLENFVNNFENLLKDLPKDFDFLSLAFPQNSHYLYKDDAEIGLENICLAKYNHFGTQCILWSKSGAKKMLDHVKLTGITHPIDLYMYGYLCTNDIINGYSIKPTADRMIVHGYDIYKSTIDLDGKRGMLNV